MKKKIIITLLIVLPIILALNSKNIYNILPNGTKFVIKKKSIKGYYDLSDNSKLLIRIFDLEPFGQLQKRYKRKNPKIKNLNNDYNVKFLPETQYGNFDLSLIKISFRNKSEVKKDRGYGFFKPFYLEIFDESLIIINNDGEILFSHLKNFNNLKNKNLKTKSVKSNLNVFKVLGTLIYNNTLFISYLSTEGTCQQFNIVSAEINFINMKFQNFFTSNACGSNLNAGRMKIYNHNGQLGLLTTLGGEKLNQPSNQPQDPSSDIGKILFIDLMNKEKVIFSSGHRNPQGLLIEDKIIISTEHGPAGGDEINKITFGKNYGWPISSYGKQYNHIQKIIGKKYLKDHSVHGFEEPIYSFVPSIGISQIIKIPNDFSKHWEDNFLLASLNGASLYRIKFNETFNSIIYIEKIFIDRRIRDLKYSKKNNAIILALEDWQEIGILKPILDN